MRRQLDQQPCHFPHLGHRVIVGQPVLVYLPCNLHAARLHIRAWLCIEETRLDVKLV
jgi:hypothetical protein